MTVLFFSTETQGAGEQLQREIETFIPGDEIEIYHTFESFSNRLRQPMWNLSVLVLVVGTREDLQELFLIRDLFNSIPVILVIPDRENDTIFTGHKLYPRFLSYIDSNYLDVAMVLNKLINKEVKKKWKN
jgi:hypothetical protein